MIPRPASTTRRRPEECNAAERNILKFCGIGPVRETLLGMVETASDEKRCHWLEAVRDLDERMR